MASAKQATFFNVAEKRATLYLVMVGVWLLFWLALHPASGVPSADWICL